MGFEDVKKNMLNTAGFFDSKKVGHIGPLGFRRSTDLSRLLSGIEELADKNIFKPFHINFLDVGCGDGRVNALMSYICEKSIGIELDDWTLEEYAALRPELDKYLVDRQSELPPGNIYLFEGDALESSTHKSIQDKTGLTIGDFDLFYTYLTLHEETAGMIVKKAKPGALFMVYGLERIMPKYDNLEILTPEAPVQGILAVYRKPL